MRTQYESLTWQEGTPHPDWLCTKAPLCFRATGGCTSSCVTTFLQLIVLLCAWTSALVLPLFQFVFSRSTTRKQSQTNNCFTDVLLLAITAKHYRVLGLSILPRHLGLTIKTTSYTPRDKLCPGRLDFQSLLGTMQEAKQWREPLL